MSEKSIHRVIKGQNYVLTPNANGWRVTCNVNRAARLHRSYQVQCDQATGRPLLCSCPDCHERGRFCKHQQEVEAILRERAEREQVGKPKATRHVLRTLGGAFIAFDVLDDDKVLVKTAAIGTPAGGHDVEELPIEAARSRYATLLRAGAKPWKIGQS